ncbi:hypothetical protein ACFQT0_15760 [Hymenobacter humi]|uniref:Uncharacterized protein n=1 Tax=Hymenobacter humi TaxID=1411620 RepID=A0ABW2U5B1_9BACT
MIPDNISGDGTDPNEGENADITENKNFPKNEELERQKAYKQDQSNNKASNDPSAARNTGANGYTQRDNQKDQLGNLHIGGSETSPQGGNDHHAAGEQAQGPGFEAEGSIEPGPQPAHPRPTLRRKNCYRRAHACRPQRIHQRRVRPVELILDPT